MVIILLIKIISKWRWPSGENVFSILVKDKLPCFIAYMNIHQLTCSCGAWYIGRSQCLLWTQIQEFVPILIYKGEKKPINSFISKNLIDSDHSTDPQVIFKVIYWICLNLPRFPSIELFKTPEGLFFDHEISLKFCVRKQYIITMSLLWLWISIVTIIYYNHHGLSSFHWFYIWKWLSLLYYSSYAIILFGIVSDITSFLLIFWKLL